MEHQRIAQERSVPGGAPPKTRERSSKPGIADGSIKMAFAITEANAGLAPETLKGIETGLAFNRDGVRWGATVFWNQIDDAIVNVTLGAGPATFPRLPPTLCSWILSCPGSTASNAWPNSNTVCPKSRC